MQKSRLRHYAILFAIYGVAVLTLAGHVVFHANGRPSNCSAPGSDSVLSVTANGWQPKEIKLAPCARLIIYNRDGQLHQLALGEHESHQTLPGYQEKTLSPGESISWQVPATPAQYKLHDHLRPDQTALVIVAPKE